MGQTMPQMSYCTWVHLYTHSYKPKRRHCHCQTETGSSNWAATSGIPPSFLEISASIKVILLHLKSPFPFSPFCIIFFFFTCLHGFCCCLSFCSTVTPPSCCWCRGPSLSKSLSLQKLSTHHLLQTDSVPDAAPKKLFSCIHCPTRLAVLPGVLALGNTFCLVNHCCRRCHGACFQRCRTDTPMIHPGIKHCTTSMECRSGKNLLGHQVHLPVVTSNHITRSIRKRLIGLSQLMGSLVWQRNKGSKVWKLRLGEVRLATRGYPI